MNIDMIEVTENNISFVIMPKQRKVLINDKYYDIEEKKIKEFLDIIRNWNHEYRDNTHMDGNMFSVNIYYNGKVDKISGVRDVPLNYAAFSEFVRSIVYDRR